jgi:hypothetical protein
LISWRPVVYQTRRARADLCDPFLRCRCLFEGDPIDDVTVRVQTAYGRSFEAGLTAAKSFPDGTSTDSGEVLVRGSHVGDRLSALLDAQDPIFFRSHTVTDDDRQAGTVTLQAFAEDQPSQPLSLAIRPEALGSVQVAVIAPTPLAHEPVGGQQWSAAQQPALINFERAHEQQYVARLADLPTRFDRTITVRTLDLDGLSLTRSVEIAGVVVEPKELAALDSPDGQLHIVVRRGSLATPARLLCWTAELRPITDAQILAGPYEVALSNAEPLKRPMLLYLGTDQLALPDDAAQANLTVCAYDRDQEQWRELQDASRHTQTIRASAGEPGIFALIQRRTHRRRRFRLRSA